MGSNGAEDGATAYGEGDAEAAAMTRTAEQGRRSDPAAAEKVPPPDTAVPSSGTTEVDVAAKLREKAEHESND